MFERTNPDIDYDALEQRVRAVLESDRAAHAEELPDWPVRTPPPERPHPQRDRLEWARRLAHRMRRWPVVGRAIQWLIDVSRPFRQFGVRREMGSRLRARVHQLRQWPVLGPVVGWGVAFLRLAHTRSRVTELEAGQQRLEAELERLGVALADLRQEAGNLRRDADGQQAALAGHDERIKQLWAAVDPLTEAVKQRGQETRQLRERMTLLGRDQFTRGEPAPVTGEADASTEPAESDTAMGAFYAALEDHFRGPEEQVVGHFQPYRRWIAECPAVAAGAPVLDLGCGRGEWLTLLAEWGFRAEGVERNPAALERCRAQGLSVRDQDLEAALEAREAGTVGAITAFHVAEHLPFPRLLTVMRESLRVLAPGGRLVLETPNPENLNVGAHTFHLDPTHVQPLPPALLAFAAEYLGYADVTVERLHPVPEAYKAPEEGAVATHVNARLYGPQDYGLIATKASEEEGAQ